MSKRIKHPGLTYPEDIKSAQAPEPQSRIKWTMTQVADMVNNRGFNLSECAREIGINRATVSIAVKKQGWKYNRQEKKMWKEEAQ